MSASRLLTLFVVVFASLATSHAMASPQDLFGIGPRMGAMASTGVAYSDSWEAVYVNPANLGRIRRKGLSLGIQLGDYNLRINDERLTHDPISATTIGATLPIPFGGVLADRFTIGFGFYTPTGIIISGMLGLATTPQFIVLNRAQSAAVIIGLGFDFHGIVDGLRLGFSMDVLGSFAGQVVAGINATGRFGSTVETQVVASYAPIVGATYDFKNFQFGATWRGEVISRFVFDIVTSDLPVTVPTLTIGGIAQYDPHNISAEVGWQPVPELRLALGASYKMWSKYPGPLTRSSASSDAPPDVNFHDTFTPRVSGEYTLTRGRTAVAFRLGYSFEPTPAPVARSEARYVDNDRHIATAGMGVTHTFGNNVALTLDGFLHGGFLTPRSHDTGTTDDAMRNMRSTGAVYLGGWQAGVSW